MSHARNLAISQRDFYRLNNLSLACRGLESLLITQDADMRGTLNPMQLAALLAVLAEGIEQATDESSNAQIRRNQHRRRRGLTGGE
ncbi:hypothetical protein ACEVVA_002087 [Salmonella enterica]|nr:hypothetical protein [Salmonella enterica]EDJ5493150.1 hypothetical protein [Salmonella enterica]